MAKVTVIYFTKDTQIIIINFQFDFAFLHIYTVLQKKNSIQCISFSKFVSFPGSMQKQTNKTNKQQNKSA